MNVEESFGIEIPDSEAQHILTVGDLLESVRSRTELAPAGKCLSAATFYEIKQALRNFEIEERFGPSTRLIEIMPPTDRRLFWTRLAQRMQMKFPPLVRTDRVERTIIVVTLIASLSLAGWIGYQTSSVESFFVAWLISAIGVCVLGYGLTRPLATHFDTDMETFRGFSERLLALNAEQQRSKHGPMGSKDLWVVLREIIVDQLGVDRDEVTPTARFVQDLGCD